MSSNDYSFIKNFANEAADLEIRSQNEFKDSKKSIWLKMANELESENVPKHKISTIIANIIEEAMQRKTKDEKQRFINSYFYRVMSEAGYTNPQFDRTSKETALHGEQENSSLSSRELTGEKIKERKQYIDFQEEIIRQAKANIDILEKGEFTEINETTHKEETHKLKWSEFFTIENDGLFQVLRDIFYNDFKDWNKQRDNRQSLLPKQRFLMTALSSILTNKHLCSTYYAKVKSKSEITPKKFTQYQRDVQSISDLFWQHKTDAWKWNFLDIKCPDCKEESLQVRLYESGDWKFVCMNWKAHNQNEKSFASSLFSDRLKQLQLNAGGSALKYLEKKGIEIPDY